MKRYLLVIVFFCLTLPLSAFELDEKISIDPQVKIGQFKNGLTYYIRENKKPENRAQLWLVVNAGSVLEDDDQQGYAHLGEHMAFNGTKNFAKQELIDYLESIGMKFGPEINAYTSFDETVYMLQLPTDDNEIMQQGFQILEDWAHQVSYDEEEIDKERGVVIEEWRLGRGASARIRDKQFPILFQDSQYAERLPIGKIDILESSNNDALRRFYKEWYRPELMAVVAVGDFDTENIEKMIKQHFSKIKNPKKARDRQYFDVPNHQETLFAIATDKEQPRTMVSVYFKQPVDKVETVDDYKKMLMESLFNQMLNERFRELTQQADPPFIYASAGKGLFVRTKNVFYLGAGVKEDGIERGLDAILTEGLRVKRFGFTDSELKRAKINLLRGYEQAFNERDKTQNRSYASEYRNNFLEDEVIPGIEWELKVAKQFVPEIALQEINALAKEFITDNNRVVMVDAPERDDLVIPTDKQLQQVIAAVEEKEIEAYQDDALDIPLIAEIAEPGEIVSTKTLTEVDAEEWTLSNGVRVVLKSTDFKNDQILFNAWRWGGLSTAADTDYISSRHASSLMNMSGWGEFNPAALQKKLAGKIVSANPVIARHSEVISGSTTPQDLEILFQLLYLNFTAPRQDEQMFESYKARYKAYLENQAARPETVFSDTVTAVTNNYHPRAMNWKPEDFDKIDLAKAFQFYQQRFADTGDFNFFFVGNFDRDEMKPLIVKYLASLPNLQRENKWQDEGIESPDGVVERTVYRGIEQKASVRLIFHGDYEWSLENNYALASFRNALSIKLRQVVREDKSGTYGVRVSVGQNRIPKPEYYINISWGCDPARVEELTDTVFSVLDSIKNNGFDQEFITKTKEAQLRDFETNQKENNFWLAQLSNYYQNGLALEKILQYPQRTEALNKELLQNTARKYIDTENYFKFILLPEK